MREISRGRRTIENPSKLAATGNVQRECDVSLALRRCVCGEWREVGLDEIGSAVDDVTSIVDPLSRPLVVR